MSIYGVPKGKSYGDWQEVFADSQPMQWGAFNTGHIYGALKNNAQPASFPPHRDPTERYKYAVMAFYFRHRTHGDVLIDAGFDRSFHENPPFGNLSVTMRAYSRLLNVQYTQEDGDIDLVSQLKRLQVDPGHVFLTHLHADHTGGLPSLSSRGHLYYAKDEDTVLSRLLCGNHLKGKSNVHLLDMSSAEALEPFSHVVDVFGDGTFWALSTPGHTRDHLAYLINAAPAPALIAGDAELTTWAMEEGVLVSTGDGRRGRQEVQRSANMIRTFHEAYPRVQIWFSHDELHLQ